MISNPVLPGFHPDPSWVWHQGWAYLVTSTFGWLPGLPIYRSRDLQHWQALPPALSTPGTLSLLDHACDDGLYAPGLRHDGERFVLACTLVHRRQQRFRNFVLTSHDPLQGWSELLWLPEDIGRIDPTPFIDEDGSLWLVLNDLPSTPANPGATREIRLWQLDARTMQPQAGPWPLWQGAQLAAATAEAPRLFRRGPWYYLLIAEGGTGHHHAVTMARSHCITGPYESCRANPLLTHRHLGQHNDGITCVGHADLLAWPDGSWWGCCLAEREDATSRFIGRETWVFPVSWDDADQWPVLTPAQGRLARQIVGPCTADESRAEPEAEPDTITQLPNPEADWLALRAWPQELAEFSASAVFLSARPHGLADTHAAPALLARRITSSSGCCWVRLQPTDADLRCGLLLFFSDRKWLRWGREGTDLVLRDANDTVQLREAINPTAAANALTLGIRWQPRSLQVCSSDPADTDPQSPSWSAAIALSPWAQPVFAGAVAGIWAEGETGGVTGEMLWDHCDGIVTRSERSVRLC